MFSSVLTRVRFHLTQHDVSIGLLPGRGKKILRVFLSLADKLDMGHFSVDLLSLDYPNNLSSCVISAGGIKSRDKMLSVYFENKNYAEPLELDPHSICWWKTLHENCLMVLSGY